MDIKKPNLPRDRNFESKTDLRRDVQGPAAKPLENASQPSSRQQSPVQSTFWEEAESPQEWSKATTFFDERHEQIRHDFEKYRFEEWDSRSPRFLALYSKLPGIAEPTQHYLDRVGLRKESRSGSIQKKEVADEIERKGLRSLPTSELHQSLFGSNPNRASGALKALQEIEDEVTALKQETSKTEKGKNKA